eukprot:XP_002586305.1 hypothetical protein BRAFLDRAFT_82911 [Branchiostoma floridae]
MREQCDKLTSLGLTATCLGLNAVETNDVLAGRFQFIYTSPETILNDHRFRGMLRSEAYKGRVGLIVIDEAHTVVQWGQAGDDAGSDTPFREWFSKLGELRCLLPGTPLLAVTATASKKQRKKIQKLLTMEGCVEHVENPDRGNIKLHVSHVPSSKPLATTFDWLLQLVRGEDHRCPRILVFCKKIDDCSNIYQYVFMPNLTADQLKLVQMYHSHTPERIKVKIREDMAVSDGNIRVLLCTTAASMGTNFAGVDNVVNFGPPQELDTLLQQQGRAGRGGSQAHHLLIFNNRQLRNLDVEMLVYVRNEDNVCRRQLLLSHYGSCCDDGRIRHACCDVCTTACQCNTSECKQFNHIAHSVDTSSESDSDSESETGHVSDLELHALKVSLQQYRTLLNEQVKSGSVSTVPEVTHGFTQKVIDSVLTQCRKLKSSDDVLAMCGVWSHGQASAVFDIVSSIFDIDHDWHEETVGDSDYTGLDD